MRRHRVDAVEFAVRMGGGEDRGGYPLTAAEIAPGKTAFARRRRDARDRRREIEPSRRQHRLEAANIGNVGNVPGEFAHAALTERAAAWFNPMRAADGSCAMASSGSAGCGPPCSSRSARPARLRAWMGLLMWAASSCHRHQEPQSRRKPGLRFFKRAPARPAGGSRAAPWAAPSAAASRRAAPPAPDGAAGRPACRSSIDQRSSSSGVNSFGTSLQLGLGHLAPVDQPAPGLGQRDPHQPASALAGPAGERDHRAERHQVAGQVVDRRDRVELRARLLAGEQLALAAGDAADRLDHRVEAAARRPRPDVAEGAQRDVDDAGPQFGQLLGREAALAERARAVALREDVGLADQARAGSRGLVRLAQVELGRELAVAGVVLLVADVRAGGRR